MGAFSLIVVINLLNRFMLWYNNFRIITSPTVLAVVKQSSIFLWTVNRTLSNESDVHIPLNKLKVSYVRSSGPGGQHVNKTSTKAEVRFEIATADWLPVEARQKIPIKFPLYKPPPVSSEVKRKEALDRLKANKRRLREKSERKHNERRRTWWQSNNEY